MSGGKSRGRGIFLSSRFEEILDAAATGQSDGSQWVAQKYVERPLLVARRKFDIRQWVLVTSWDPLGVWFYDESYARFSLETYDAARPGNTFAHLTNYSIAKQAADFEGARDETMWDTAHQLRQHLVAEAARRSAAAAGAALGAASSEASSSDAEWPWADPWLEHVQPQMQKIVYLSLQAVQDQVQERARSFELFGYDFLLDDDLAVWLLEVNASPDLSHSTSTTARFVAHDESEAWW